MNYVNHMLGFSFFNRLLFQFFSAGNWSVTAYLKTMKELHCYLLLPRTKVLISYCIQKTCPIHFLFMLYKARLSMALAYTCKDTSNFFKFWKFFFFTKTFFFQDLFLLLFEKMFTFQIIDKKNVPKFFFLINSALVLFALPITWFISCENYCVELVGDFNHNNKCNKFKFNRDPKQI